MRAPSLTLLSLAALALVSTAALAGTVYKWVDEKGVTHYSDQPHPQAKEIDVTSAQTYTSQPAVTAPATTSEREEAGAPYTLCEIYRPEKDEVFLNTNTLTARLRLEPQLRLGHHVAIALDGRRLLDQPPTGTEFIISDVSRGTHSLLAVVEDKQGKALCTASAVTFHVRQPSVQAPVRAVRPKF